MFRTFAASVYYIQGGILALAMANTLLDYRAAIEGMKVSIDEFEAITSGSNAGAACVISKMEHCFIFYVAILTLIVGYYVPIEKRAIPSMAIAFCSFLIARAEMSIASNAFDVQVYQGEVTDLLGKVAYLNVFFGSLHALVSIGSFLGLAKLATSSGTTTSKNE